MKIVPGILMLWISYSLTAAPYFGEIMRFKQPDNTWVDVRLFGSEYYMRAEGVDNYTVVRDIKTGWICYATLSDDGTELISTGTVYRGIKDAVPALKTTMNIPMHLRIQEKSNEEIAMRNKKLLDGEQHVVEKMAPFVVKGNIKGLCIVVDFSDEPGIAPIGEFEDLCNDMNYSNYGNNGSLRKYFHDISGGLVDYQNVVYGYFRAPKTFAEYDAMPYSLGAKTILDLALNWIESQGFDFSTLSLNSDGSIQAINLIYTGQPETWSEGMWWHKGTYSEFSADGVHSGAYNTSTANSPLSIATIVHENGHMIGKWGDTYKYSTLDGPDGIGTFDLMCNYGNKYNPVPPNPFYRINAGWGKVVDVTSFNGEIEDSTEDMKCYRYMNVNDTNEFFLMENRSKIGRSLYIPEAGLTIWHIDRWGDNQTSHHEVYLVHANNNMEDDYNICYRSGLKTEFSPRTNPKSDFYDGNTSGLIVSDVSPRADIMTYNLGPLDASPLFKFSNLTITEDDNRNSYPEPGESFVLNLAVGNYGFADATNVTVSGSCIYNGSYVSVHNPSYFAGTVGMQDVLPLAYNISLNQNTPVGSRITMRFTVYSDAGIVYFDKAYVIGEIVLVGSANVTSDKALFYDNGGYNRNYSCLTDLTTTFLAPAEGQAVVAEFLSFAMEEEDTCAYDYLKVYNGPSDSSPLLGTWCGKNSPGIIESTDPSGALTFRFHSDEAVTGTGWEALMSSAELTSVKYHPTDDFFEVYPNPSHQIIRVHIKLPDLNNLRLVVVDSNGREVRQIGRIEATPIGIDRGEIPDGIYFVQLWNKDKLISTEILVLQ